MSTIERTSEGYYPSPTGFNYSFLFAFERKFFMKDVMDGKKVYMGFIWPICFVYALSYIIVIYTGQKIMRTREKFVCRRALISWNFVLAGFSIFGSLRLMPEFFYFVNKKGIEGSFCSSEWQFGVAGGWGGLFLLSKLPEFFDTLFIVARKQKLIFLHWYHHASVFIYVWFTCSDWPSTSLWFMFMNYSVHAVMYTYYGCRALRFNIPKWVNIVITSSQILQMVIGIYINCTVFLKKQRGEECDVSDKNLQFAFSMYFSYFILFFNFFYHSYISPKKNTTAEANGHVNSRTNGDNKGIRHVDQKDFNQIIKSHYE